MGDRLRRLKDLTPDELAAIDRPFGRGRSDLEQANRIFRTKLALKEGQGMDTLAHGYASLAGDLRERVNLLKDKVKAAEKAGTNVTPDWLYRQERYKDLILQTQQGLIELGGTTKDLLSEQSKYFVESAEDYARKASRAQLERTAPSSEAVSSVMARFNSLPEEQIKGLLGNLETGSPLNKLLFEGVPSETMSAVKSSLLETVGLGLGTAQGGRDLNDALGLGLSRSMTIVRTETHRLQRDATRLSYKANEDIVKGWEWRCARTAETCEVCWAMDGTTFDVGETMDTHVNCRCTLVPKTRSWEELGFGSAIPEIYEGPSGANAFGQMSESDQRKVLGNKFEAWSKGDLTLKDMVGQSFSQEWGASRHSVSLAQAYANAGKTLPATVRDTLLVKPPVIQPAAIAAHEQAIKDLEQIAIRQEAELQSQVIRDTELREQYRELQAERLAYQNKFLADNPDKDVFDFFRDPKFIEIRDRQEAVSIDMAAHSRILMGIRERYASEGRSLLYVDDPIKVNVTMHSTKDVNSRWQGGVDAFERFISKAAHPSLDGMNVDMSPLRSGGRAYARNGEVHVTRDEGLGVVVHELGHNAEYKAPDILKKSVAWRDGRAAGEKPSWMGGSYRRDERAVADKFRNKYIGKDYQWGGDHVATEVLSMGLQYFYEDPMGLAAEDPDMFRYIYNVVRGIK